MNYTKVHDAIIHRAKMRDRPTCYCEKHHILPRSMGGDDSPENIVVLTAREHFIIHWLLKNIHQNKQMVYAFFSMTKPVGNGRIRYTSHAFKYARESVSRWISKNRSGENHPFYGLFGEKNPHFGMKRSYETRKSLSRSAIDRFKREDNPRCTEIRCIETGDVFNSISSAARFFPKGNIHYALHSGGTAGGYHFEYTDGRGAKSPLKGYPKGKDNTSSVKVFSDNGEQFDTVADAGASVGATGTAVSLAIKNNRPCKGVRFYRNEA